MNDTIDNTDVNQMEPGDIHTELKEHGIKLHHKTGTDKLRATLNAVRDGSYEAPTEAQEAIPTAPINISATVTRLTPAQHIMKLTKTEKAMRMQRIVVSPNDPLMSSYNGLIFTVGSSSINSGKMIKKYVPFNNDDGWHVPQIIIDQIEAAEMQKFRTVNTPNGDKTLQPYLTKKFNVQILDPLTQAEMEILAASQASKGAA